MSISSYQIGRLLARLRVWYQAPPRHPVPSEHVALSVSPGPSNGGASAPEDFAQMLRAAAGVPIPADVVDQRPLAPSVDYELERRAGSFLDPRYPGYGPPAGIPRAKPTPGRGD
ncbi:MAG: hypothetical protein HY342_11765 [Candidatus Lambdaproteobacteria bacterium]|nr:hypothetical protein [Candidatus Lambdaproteobacteria bacterium]